MERFRLYWKGRGHVITNEWLKERINALKQHEVEMFNIVDYPIQINDAFMILIPVYFSILGFLILFIALTRKYYNKIIMDNIVLSNGVQYQQLQTSEAA